MQRRIQIPDYPRYAYARQRAHRLLCELEIGRLPVDSWKVAEALPNVHRGTLTEAEYKVLEREADTFAVNLLAPMTIINRLPSIQTKADFMELCNLSGEASDNCMEELRLLKSGKKLPFPIKEEDVLHRLFFRFINEFNRTEVPSLSYDALEIDETFDDYIECDYWAFTLMAIR